MFAHLYGFPLPSKISHSIIELVLALVEDAIEVVVEGVVDEIEKLDITVEELELAMDDVVVVVKVDVNEETGKDAKLDNTCKWLGRKTGDDNEGVGVDEFNLLGLGCKERLV